MTKNNIQLVAFDLDDTLAPSKTPIDSEMMGLLRELLKHKKVAIISGAKLSQIQKQLPENMPDDVELQNLYLFPTCSSSAFCYDNGWQQMYEETLSDEEKEKIFAGFEKAFEETGFKKPENPFGALLEDRRSMVAFSALGQDAPFELKRPWDPDGAKRKVIVDALQKHIPDFEARIGGTTSIDVTRRGIDKAHGIRNMEKHLGIPKHEMFFIGDALFPGGNDYPVKEVGVPSQITSGPEETKRIIAQLLEEM
ncbi:MAG: HAD-IIB family hydrolase [Parcubacteria group bacterium]|nr:HAD-IIB family hydrolase [Parcubacteria group bacterium]